MALNNTISIVQTCKPAKSYGKFHSSCSRRGNSSLNNLRSNTRLEVTAVARHLPYIWSISAGTYKMYSAVNGELQAEWYNLPAGATVANSTTVPTIFGGVTYVPGIATTAVTVLTGTLVLEQPNPTVVGQDIGGASRRRRFARIHLWDVNPGQTTGMVSLLEFNACYRLYCNDYVDWPQVLSGQLYRRNRQQTLDYWPTIAPQQTTMPLNWNLGNNVELNIPTDQLTHGCCSVKDESDDHPIPHGLLSVQTATM